MANQAPNTAPSLPLEIAKEVGEWLSRLQAEMNAKTEDRHSRLSVTDKAILCGAVAVLERAEQEILSRAIIK